MNCNEVISICKFCCHDLPWITRACFSCGLPLAEAGLSANHCANCLLNPPPINYCRGAFHYLSPINKLITGFKFHNQFDIGFSLATLLAGEIQKEYAETSKPDLLIPVPLHPARLRSRGFNQALEISKIISRHTAIPIGKNLVEKVKNTRAQTELESAVKRKRNQNKAFRRTGEPWPENVKHIAIIDDVVTTMATVVSLAETLQSHGIRHIDAWSLARAST